MWTATSATPSIWRPPGKRCDMTVTVSGYASLDRAMLVDRLPVADETALVQRRLSTPWPRSGGAAHVARAVRARGVEASLVSWIGDDEAGERYLSDLRDAGIDTAGVVRSGSRSPASWLFYDEEGRAACCFDPGEISYVMTAPQRRLLDRSDWWVVAVGPAAVTHDVLDELEESATRLAWVVKADREAFPAPIVDRLLDHCELITLSRAEREFLTTATGGDPLGRVRSDALVIETRGGDDVWFRGPDGPGTIPVDRVSCPDTTGAGDTLAGAAVAALARGDPAPHAAEHGVRAARRFLRSRQESPRD